MKIHIDELIGWTYPGKGHRIFISTRSFSSGWSKWSMGAWPLFTLSLITWMESLERRTNTRVDCFYRQSKICLKIVKIFRILFSCSCSVTESHQTFRTLRLWSARLPLSIRFSGKNAGMGYLFLLQRIFLCLLQWQVDSPTTKPPGKLLRFMYVC